MTEILQEGQAAPDFTAQDQDGNEVSLKDYSDRWLVLYFYPKDNTPGCTVEANDFTSLKDEFAAVGTDILGVSPDSIASHCKFIDKHDLTIKLLSDPEKNVIEAYKVWRLKKFMGKEFMGVVRSTFLIAPDGTLAKVWNNVRTKGHAEKVLAEVKNQQQQ